MTDRLTWLLGAVVALGCALNATLAEGQGAADYTEREILVARLAVNEGSWRERDAAAIAYARATWTVARLRSGHRRALAPVRTDARRWIADLHPDGHEPEGWPAHLDWEQHRPRWLAVLETVRGVLDGRVPDHCATGRPQSWAGPIVDRERLARVLASGGRIVCTGTVNVFVQFGRRR